MLLGLNLKFKLILNLRHLPILPLHYLPNFLTCKICHQQHCLPDREYMLEMERSLRQVNIDYQQVGFYQSTYLNTHCDRNFLDSVFDYLEEMNEAIALIYGS